MLDPNGNIHIPCVCCFTERVMILAHMEDYPDHEWLQGWGSCDTCGTEFDFDAPGDGREVKIIGGQVITIGAHMNEGGQ